MGAHRGEVITVRPGAPSSFPLTHTPSFLSPLPQSVGAPELRKRSGAEAAPDKLETSPSQTGCGLRTGWGSWGGAGAGRGEGLRGNEQSSLRPGPQYRPSALQTPVPVLPRARLSSCHHELQKDHGGRGGGLLQPQPVRTQDSLPFHTLRLPSHMQMSPGAPWEEDI